MPEAVPTQEVGHVLGSERRQPRLASFGAGLSDLLRVAVESLEVDTTDGYRPSFGQILSFVNAVG